MSSLLTCVVVLPSYDRRRLIIFFFLLACVCSNVSGVMDTSFTSFSVALDFVMPKPPYLTGASADFGLFREGELVLFLIVNDNHLTDPLLQNKKKGERTAYTR